MSLPTQYNGKNQDPVGALSSTLARLQVGLKGGAAGLRKGVQGSSMPVHARAAASPAMRLRSAALLLALVSAPAPCPGCYRVGHALPVALPTFLQLRSS